MLKGDFFQAKYYLDDAIKEAKNDVTLETLSIVYLSQCAMKKAMTLKTECQSYEALKRAGLKSKHDDYKKMLLSQEVDDISALGQYSSLYKGIQKKEVTLSDIKSLGTIYTQAIGAILVNNHGLMNEKIINYMIDKASAENMKGLMLIWLKKSQ